MLNWGEVEKSLEAEVKKEEEAHAKRDARNNPERQLGGCQISAPGRMAQKKSIVRLQCGRLGHIRKYCKASGESNRPREINKKWEYKWKKAWRKRVMGPEKDKGSPEEKRRGNRRE